MKGRRHMGDLATKERLLVAALKDMPALIDELQLSEELFADKTQKAIFKAVQDATTDPAVRGAIDTVVIADKAKKYGVSFSDVAGLPAVYGDPQYYANELLEHARKKRLAGLSCWIRDNIGKADAKDMLEHIETEITAISVSAKPLVRMSEVIPGFLEKVEARALGTETMGIKTGYDMLDNAIGGLRPGRIMVIAARTGQGKSTIALNMAAHIAAAGKRVGFFSCEMERQEVAERLVALLGNVDCLKLATGKDLRPIDFNGITEGCGKIYNMDFYLDDTQYIKISELKSRIRKMARQGIDVVFIDYLTLIDLEDNRLPRPERVGLLCKILNRISGEIGVPIVALSQLNRNAEGKEPSIADLRQSGEVEEDARAVLMIWREDEHSQNLIAELKKNGGGPKAKFKLGYNPARMQITNEWF